VMQEKVDVVRRAIEDLLQHGLASRRGVFV
jgi:hypothetical protein